MIRGHMRAVTRAKKFSSRVSRTLQFAVRRHSLPLPLYACEGDLSENCQPDGFPKFFFFVRLKFIFVTKLSFFSFTTQTSKAIEGSGGRKKWKAKECDWEKRKRVPTPPSVFPVRLFSPSHSPYKTKWTGLQWGSGPSRSKLNLFEFHKLTSQKNLRLWYFI